MLPTAHERCGKMGTLEKDGSKPLSFDGKPESWPRFKKALYHFLDKEGYGWVAEGGDAFCVMLQAAAAKAAKSTVTSGKVTVSTNVANRSAMADPCGAHVRSICLHVRGYD